MSTTLTTQSLPLYVKGITSGFDYIAVMNRRPQNHTRCEGLTTIHNGNQTTRVWSCVWGYKIIIITQGGVQYYRNIKSDWYGLWDQQVSGETWEMGVSDKIWDKQGSETITEVVLQYVRQARSWWHNYLMTQTSLELQWLQDPVHFQHVWHPVRAKPLGHWGSAGLQPQTAGQLRVGHPRLNIVVPLLRDQDVPSRGYLPQTDSPTRKR